MASSVVQMIRRFRPGDLREVHDLANVGLGENYSPSFILDIHSFWPDLFLVADEGGAISGFIAGILLSGVHARIVMLAVREEKRRRGVGSLLCREFIQRCGLRGVRLITLEVRSSNLAAIALYRRMGFQIMMKLEKYYSDGEAAYRMQMIL